MALFTNEQIADALDGYLAHANHPLEPLQVDLERDILRDVRAGNNSGNIISPGGTGKTVMFGATFDALKPHILQNIGSESDGALLVTDTVNAAVQAYETMTTKLRRDGSGKPLFGWHPDEVKIFHGDTPEREKREALKAPLLIMTLSGFYSRQNSGYQIRERRQISNLDEVDAQKGDKMGPFIRQHTTANFVWGWSATDTYATPTGFVRIGPELFGRDAPIHQTSLKLAAEQKRIVPVRNIVFVTNLESGLERRLRGNIREYTNEENRAIIEQPGRDDAAVRSVLSFVDPQTGIAFKDLNQIWYCFGVIHADRIAQRLNAVYAADPEAAVRYPYGFAAAVSGKTPKKDWEDETGRHLGLESIVELHKEGIIPAITNADIFIRSFDSPRTELSVMLRGVRAPTMVEQAGSRITRLLGINPFKLGYVASFLDRDMAGALVFSDISGDVNLGLEENVAYVTHNSPRHPNLDFLNPGTQVDVDVLWRPKDIAGFFTERRAVKEKLRSELAPIRPEGLLTLSEFAIRAGVYQSRAEDFFKAVEKAYKPFEERKAEIPFSLGTFNLTTAEVGRYRASEHVVRDRASFHIHEKYIQPFLDFYNECLKWGLTYFSPGVYAWNSDWYSHNDISEVSNCPTSEAKSILNRLVPVASNPGYMVDPQTSLAWRVTAEHTIRTTTRLIHKDDLIRFMNEYNLGMFNKTDVWLSDLEIAEKITRDLKPEDQPNQYIAQIVERLEPVDNASHRMRDPLTGSVWEARLAAYSEKVDTDRYNYEWRRYEYTYVSRTKPCLFLGEYARFVEFYRVNIPSKKVDWLSATDIAGEHGMELEKVKVIFDRWQPVPDKQGYMLDSENGKQWPAEEHRFDGVIEYCLRKSSIQSFLLQYKYEPKPDEWLSVDDMAQRLKDPDQSKLRGLMRRFRPLSGAKEIKDFEYMQDGDGNLWKAKTYKIGATAEEIIACLHESELPRWAAKHGFELLPLPIVSWLVPVSRASDRQALSLNHQFSATFSTPHSPLLYSLTLSSSVLPAIWGGFVEASAKATSPANGASEETGDAQGIIKIANATLDFENRSLTVGRKNINLTESEFLILYKAASDPDSPLVWRTLSDFVGENSFAGICPQEATINNYIGSIRRKIREHNNEFASALVTISRGQYSFAASELRNG